jgi:hypothetical protein
VAEVLHSRRNDVFPKPEHSDACKDDSYHGP